MTVDRDFAQHLERALFDSGIRSFDKFVIFGSAVMKVYGLKDEIGDVDLFIDAGSYARLRRDPRWGEFRPREDDPPFLRSEQLGLPLAVFYAWTTRDRWMDVPDVFRSAVSIVGVPFASLEEVAKHKREALADLRTAGVDPVGTRWEKHVHDLAAIEAHLAAGTVG